MKRTESKDLVNIFVIYPFNSRKGNGIIRCTIDNKCLVHTYNKPDNLRWIPMVWLILVRLSTIHYQVNSNVLINLWAPAQTGESTNEYITRRESSRRVVFCLWDGNVAAQAACLPCVKGGAERMRGGGIVGDGASAIPQNYAPMWDRICRDSCPQLSVRR